MRLALAEDTIPIAGEETVEGVYDGLSVCRTGLLPARHTRMHSHHPIMLLDLALTPRIGTKSERVSDAHFRSSMQSGGA